MSIAQEVITTKQKMKDHIRVLKQAGHTHELPQLLEHPKLSKETKQPQDAHHTQDAKQRHFRSVYAYRAQDQLSESRRDDHNVHNKSKVHEELRLPVFEVDYHDGD